MDILIAIIQGLIITLLAPLASGFARWMRARMHTRRGPSIMQDYYDIAKLFKRQDVHSASSSFIHKLMPPLFVACMFLLGMGIPMITMYSPIPELGDIIFILYMMALPRFFFALSAIDSGDAYAGIGGIRELIVGILVEPSLILALFVAAIATGSTSVGGMATSIAAGVVSSPLGVIVAGIAFAIACYVELGKLPFDVAEAEQELQEGPLQEYSGPSLAMAKVAMSMKQIVVLSWFFAIFLPFGAATDTTPVLLLIGLVAWAVKMIIGFAACCVVENVVSRVRFKFMGRKTWAIFAVSVVALILCAVGV